MSKNKHWYNAILLCLTLVISVYSKIGIFDLNEKNGDQSVKENNNDDPSWEEELVNDPKPESLQDVNSNNVPHKHDHKHNRFSKAETDEQPLNDQHKVKEHSNHFETVVDNIPKSEETQLTNPTPENLQDVNSNNVLHKHDHKHNRFSKSETDEQPLNDQHKVKEHPDHFEAAVDNIPKSEETLLTDLTPKNLQDVNFNNVPQEHFSNAETDEQLNDQNKVEERPNHVKTVAQNIPKSKENLVSDSNPHSLKDATFNNVPHKHGHKHNLFSNHEQSSNHQIIVKEHPNHFRTALDNIPKSEETLLTDPKQDNLHDNVPHKHSHNHNRFSNSETDKQSSYDQNEAKEHPYHVQTVVDNIPNTEDNDLKPDSLQNANPNNVPQGHKQTHFSNAETGEQSLNNQNNIEERPNDVNTVAQNIPNSKENLVGDPKSNNSNNVPHKLGHKHNRFSHSETDEQPSNDQNKAEERPNRIKAVAQNIPKSEETLLTDPTPDNLQDVNSNNVPHKHRHKHNRFSNADTNEQPLNGQNKVEERPNHVKTVVQNIPKSEQNLVSDPKPDSLQNVNPNNVPHGHKQTHFSNTKSSEQSLNNQNNVEKRPNDVNTVAQNIPNSEENLVSDPKPDSLPNVNSNNVPQKHGHTHNRFSHAKTDEHNKIEERPSHFKTDAGQLPRHRKQKHLEKKQEAEVENLNKNSQTQESADSTLDASEDNQITDKTNPARHHMHHLKQNKESLIKNSHTQGLDSPLDASLSSNDNQITDAAKPTRHHIHHTKQNKGSGKHEVTSQIHETENKPTKNHRQPTNEADESFEAIQRLEDHVQKGNTKQVDLSKADLSQYPPNVRKTIKKLRHLAKHNSKVALRLLELKGKDPKNKDLALQIASLETSHPVFKPAEDYTNDVPAQSDVNTQVEALSNIVEVKSVPMSNQLIARKPGETSVWTGVGIGIGSCLGLFVLVSIIVVVLKKRRTNSKLQETSFHMSPDQPNYLHRPKNNNARYIVTVLDESRVSDPDSMWSSDEEEIFDVSNLKSDSPVIGLGPMVKSSVTSTPVKKLFKDD